MKPTPDQVAEAERLVEASLGPSTWNRRCRPRKPCEVSTCPRGACRGLSRARATLRRRETRQQAAARAWAA